MNKILKINFHFLTVVRHDHLSFHFGTVGQNALVFSLPLVIYIKAARLHLKGEDWRKGHTYFETEYVQWFTL